MTYSDPSQPQAPQAPEPYGQPVAGGEDPGKTLGIVGLVLAFVFSLAGLIVSIIARNRSKAAGYSNGVATAGIIISIVLLVVSIVSSIFLVAGLMTLSAGVNEQICDTLGTGEHVIEGQTYTCE